MEAKSSPAARAEELKLQANEAFKSKNLLYFNNASFAYDKFNFSKFQYG